MSLPTDSQWARYSVLCAQLRPLAPAARQAQLAAWQAAGGEDPQVLSLVALHYTLPPDPERDRTGERLGAFTLEELLGAGGMGIVYRAQQHFGRGTRPVAVKLIHPALLRTAQEEALERFQQEIGLLVQLEHEGIARIYDGGIGADPHTHEPVPYIAMELVRDGLPLTTYAQAYALTWPERLALFLRVCRAVQYAHEHRVIHRDLKPGNILVDSEGRPVVLDFGLAQTWDAILPGTHLAVSGTPAYMSPEQVSVAWGAISNKSDVYALGLMLYELLTGQHPYAQLCDGSVPRLRQVHTEVTLPPLCQYSTAYGEELEAVLAAALAKRPAERLSVAVLRSRLERYLQQLPLDRDRPRRGTRRKPRHTIGTIPESRTPGAERRHLTILFCDLVASTALATQLDPEDLREVIRAYHATCATVIQRLDGHIAQYLGDGVLVYYGYPQAHEDAAYRAVRTGLGIVEGMGPLNACLEQAYGIRLAVRIGIHTGLVVVGEIGGVGREEPLALGATPNIAARLQGCALPDTVVMSDATWRLVQGAFACHDFGVHPLPGVATPVQLYQILRESPIQNRFAAAHIPGLHPLVGRQQEVGLLRERWRQVTNGLGQVMLLSGEAGIGKSRLIQAFKEHLAGDVHTCIECHGSPYYQQSAFHSLIERMQEWWQFDTDDTPEEKLRKLEKALPPYHVALEEVVPLFAALLGLPLPERYPPLTLTPQRQKQKTLEVMLAWLIKEAARQPVCFIMEDLHWVDASTLEFLSLLMDQVPTLRMLVLLLFRPEFHPPWVDRSLSQLTLTRLSPSEVTLMITQLTGGKTLPAEVHQHVVATTDGVPLFVEEVTKMVLESGLLQEREECYALAGPLPFQAIPVTLHDALMARLDRLGPAKQVAQLGAVLGREFPYELIQAIWLADTSTLHQLLRRLVEAELLYQQGLPPHATYLFKHALIRETAYQSLLRSTRRQYHQQIAQVLEERFPDSCTLHPELVAQHYTEAGCNALAVPYWQRAGQRAVERSAHAEAIVHLSNGLQVLATLPESPERLQRELTLQLALSVPLMATKGYAAPDVEQVYTRLQEICRHVGDYSQLFSVLIGWRRLYMGRQAYQAARKVGEQLVQLAQCQQDPIAQCISYMEIGPPLYFLGELASARTHLEEALKVYDVLHHQGVAARVGMHPMVSAGAHPLVMCLSWLTSILWHLGYPDQAEQRRQEALTLAQALQSPVSLAVCLSLGVPLYHLRCEPQAVRTYAETLVTLSTEQGFAYFLALGTLMRGWAMCMQGEGTDGLAQIHQGFALLRATGSRYALSYYLTLLAEAYIASAQPAAALRVLAEAQEVVNTTGERMWEAEVYRLTGELLLQEAMGKREQEAEAYLERALAVAHHHQEKSLELRAAMSLGRLWQHQGRPRAARHLVTEVYNWFTEGFETPDLRAARTLLEELGEQGLL
jgi:TOMM system kinase/cyclase fusion protein